MDAGAVVDGFGERGVFAPRLTGVVQPLPRIFRTVAFNACEVSSDRPYVVKNLVEPATLVLGVGEPGSGKSLVVPLLAHCVATGTNFFGRRVRQRPVLYLASEAGPNMLERMAALRLVRGPSVEPLEIVPATLDLTDPGGTDHSGIVMLVERMQPGLVIVDTIAAGFPGLIENEAGPMGAAAQSLRMLAGSTDAAVFAVHHTSKGGTTPRGHSNLNGTADAVLLVEGEGGEPRKVTVRKNKAGPSGGSFHFNIRVVDCGEDTDGDRITLPHAEEELDADGALVEPGPKLPPLSLRALGILTDLCAGPEGKQLPTGGGWPDARLVGAPEERWREECDTRRLSTSEKPDSRRRSVQREITRLRDAGAVAFRDGWVWPTGPGGSQ